MRLRAKRVASCGAGEGTVEGGEPAAAEARRDPVGGDGGYKGGVECRDMRTQASGGGGDNRVRCRVSSGDGGGVVVDLSACEMTDQPALTEQQQAVS